VGACPRSAPLGPGDERLAKPRGQILDLVASPLANLRAAESCELVSVYLETTGVAETICTPIIPSQNTNESISSSRKAGDIAPICRAPWTPPAGHLCLGVTQAGSRRGAGH
jgi:hypothetical protein